MRDVVFIRGLNHGGPSAKWLFIKSLPDVNAHLIEPNWSKGIHQSIEDCLLKILDLKNPVIIGHSVSCIHARLISAAVGLSAILINPVMEPMKYTQFQGHGFTEALQIAAKSKYLNKKFKEIVLVELGDEVVNQPAQIAAGFFDLSTVWQFSNGKHQFVRIEKIKDAIDVITGKERRVKAEER